MRRIALTSLALLAPVLIAVPASAAGETCDGLAATIVVPLEMAYPDDPYWTKPVTGTAGDDVIVGTALGDTINGAGGNDVICGLDGADTLTGGEGNDRLFGGLDGAENDPLPNNNSSLGDLLAPGPGDDYVDLGLDPDADERTFRPDQVRYDDSATAVTVDLNPVNGLGRATGEGSDTIVVRGAMTLVGSPFDDHVTGTPYGDTLMTDRGSDVVLGADGNDLILPDIAGYDVMETADPEGEGFASPDTVDGGAGDDFIGSLWGPLAVEAGEGDDYVSVSDPEAFGNGTADGSSISTGAGDDQVFAEFVGTLEIDAGSGDDEVFHSVYAKSGRGLTSHGGDGDDRLDLRTVDVTPGTSVIVDRRRSRIATTGTKASMKGYEHHALSGKSIRWVYRGTGARDDVSTGLGRSLRAFTFGGRDNVEGTRDRDFLHLGRGRDTADGSLRRDICISVERAKSCEVRR